MHVRVLFFGMLTDLTGRRGESFEVSAHTTVGDLLVRCIEKFPKLSGFSDSLALSINQEYASRTAVLHEDDEVALLPPVSGGTIASERHSELNARLVREKIETQKVVDAVKHAEDGAVGVFEGIVRNHSRGRRTLYLEYEAYEEMALRQVQALIDEAKKKFTIRDAIIIHRLGRLEIGETSVLIVVASAHRAAAFDACRWLIDTLKQQVPIWKKEFFEDGAVWAPGEAFPAEVRQS
jgi:molybdopterin synthase catalytic subunit